MASLWIINDTLTQIDKNKDMHDELSSLFNLSLD